MQNGCRKHRRSLVSIGDHRKIADGRGGPAGSALDAGGRCLPGRSPWRAGGIERPALQLYLCAGSIGGCAQQHEMSEPVRGGGGRIRISVSFFGIRVRRIGVSVARYDHVADHRRAGAAIDCGTLKCDVGRGLRTRRIDDMAKMPEWRESALPSDLRRKTFS